MVALVAVVLFGVAALSVDLGQAFVRQQERQQRADRAALAAGAGANLPAPTSTSTCAYGSRANASDGAVKDAAAYLGATLADGSVTATSLVDCDLTNGEVVYGTLTPSAANPSGSVLTPNPDQVTVVTPHSHVSFGFAPAIGFDGVDVAARATAEIRSPAIDTVPFYAYVGCDFGQQTIQQPNNGHAAGLLLSHPDETNAATLTPTGVNLPLGLQGQTLTLTGGLAGVTDVGFFEAGLSGAGPEPVVVPATSFTAATPLSITLPVPTTVSSVEEVWYVRVKQGGTWSAVTDKKGNLLALPLTIGNPPLTCGQGSNQGNFGTLRIANTLVNSTNDQIAMNIAAGLQHSLAIWVGATSPWQCRDGDIGAVVDKDGTNCVGTDPGMSAQAAQAGFIEGVKGVPGRLARNDGASGCGNPPRNIGGILVNNDTLSCFFTDSSTTVSQVSGPAYSLPGPALSAKIYESPRFALVPVLGEQPGTGNKSYKIVTFRPAFITDQVDSATKATPPTSANGLTVNGTLQSVQVIFLNAAALPTIEGSGQTTTYGGSGPKVLQLVD